MCHADPIMGGAGEDVRPVEQLSIATGSEQLPAFISRPAGPGPWPAILLISDVFGASAFYQEMAGQLAHLGYLTLVPDFFCRVGPLAEQTLEAAVARSQKLTDDLLIQDVYASIDHLAGRDDVEPKRPGVMGFCMGGTLTMIMAARRGGDIAGGASFYGFPVNRRPAPGRQLSPIDEVAGTSAPLIAFWGEDDANVGMDNVDRWVKAMQEQGKDVSYTIYPNAHHGFMARRAEADVAAADDAWPAMLQFFDKTLRVGSLAGR